MAQPQIAHGPGHAQWSLNAWRGHSDSLQPPDGLERRDNYSMGKGNYLSDHGWDGAGTGWVVKSYALPAKWASLTEDAIPEAAPAAAAAPAAVDGEVTVTPGTRPGYVEVRFATRPAEDVRAGLKAHGFRWARSSQSWYGRDKAYAESLLQGCCDSCRAEQA